MDDDPHHTIEHHIEQILRPVTVIGLRKRLVVNTRGLEVCTRKVLGKA
jgi:hypothetical protein